MTVYRFEDIDDSLPLVPLAGRRALDRAGRKVGLAAWQTLSIESRRSIVRAGSDTLVYVRDVLDAIGEVASSQHDAWPEPSDDTIPIEVLEACVDAPLPIERWRSLRALDRWSMTSLARRGKREALAALRGELGV